MGRPSLGLKHYDRTGLKSYFKRTSNKISVIVIRIIMLSYLWVLLRDFLNSIASTEFEQLVEGRYTLARRGLRLGCSLAEFYVLQLSSSYSRPAKQEDYMGC